MKVRDKLKLKINCTHYFARIFLKPIFVVGKRDLAFPSALFTACQQLHFLNVFYIFTQIYYQKSILPSLILLQSFFIENGLNQEVEPLIIAVSIGIILQKQVVCVWLFVVIENRVQVSTFKATFETQSPSIPQSFLFFLYGDFKGVQDRCFCDFVDFFQVQGHLIFCEQVFIELIKIIIHFLAKIHFHKFLFNFLLVIKQVWMRIWLVLSFRSCQFVGNFVEMFVIDIKGNLGIYAVWLTKQHLRFIDLLGLGDIAFVIESQLIFCFFIIIKALILTIYHIYYCYKQIIQIFCIRTILIIIPTKFHNYYLMIAEGEEPKTLKFVKLCNDRQERHMKLLIDFKNLISKQLPSMDKQHITRLLFDQRHFSILLLDNSDAIIGGVCFRMFGQNDFIEIAFLAVRAEAQTRGNGYKIMNELKNEMQGIKIKWLVVHADNSAIGFFKKNGFSQTQCASKNWEGYLKSYQKSTLMECQIYQGINYHTLKEQMKEKRRIMENLIYNMTLNYIQYDAPKLPINKKSQKQQFRINPRELPGISESGWNQGQHKKLIQDNQISLEDNCKKILSKLSLHPSIWPFRQPVSDETPNYFQIIQEPIDLKKISRKLKDKKYSCLEEFEKDLQLMLSNCKFFNQPGTVYYKCADQVQKFIQEEHYFPKNGK